eukprot:gb/GECG01012619.1/.p1 GENE.gb/GECG01012619.1/~~gb/GECG01012619.1/.p1  ORF type:complete len:501 (+),score=29.85 gb/GECG01012619.1/:1-1503(+)
MSKLGGGHHPHANGKANREPFLDIRFTRGCVVATLVSLTILGLSLSYSVMLTFPTQVAVAPPLLTSVRRQGEHTGAHATAKTTNITTTATGGGSGGGSHRAINRASRLLDTSNTGLNKHVLTSYRFPTGCELFRRHLEERLFSVANSLTSSGRESDDDKKGKKRKRKTKEKSTQPKGRQSGFKIKVVSKLTRHLLVLEIPHCGGYVLKLSCRPPMSYWLGKQAWPEIVANILDQDVFGYNLSYPAYGMVMPLSMLTAKPMLPKQCIFRFGKERVLMGALTPFANFTSYEKTWYNRQCNAASPRFLGQLFRLNVLDYLVLNTDRHMDKNWFRDPNENIVAMDNGAWSFHNHSFVCDANEYHRQMFEVVRVLKSKLSKCQWIKNTAQPVCTLARHISNSSFVQALAQTPPAAWQDQFESTLQRDLWFRWAPSVFSATSDAVGGAIGHILARDMSSCGRNIQTAGISKNTSVTLQQLSRFLFADISHRFNLAQQTIRRCLEKG